MRRLLAALLVVLSGGCKVDISVGLHAGADGNGEVRVAAVLDEVAAERLGDPGTALRLDDLEGEGWVVDEPERREDGSLVLSVRHRFDDIEEGERLLAAVGGDDASTGAAPLRDVEIEQHRGFFRTQTSVTGVVDLVRGVESFGDAALTSALGGQPLGVSVEQMERQLGAPFAEMFGLQVAVSLPGEVVANAPATSGDTAVWAPALGERLELVADASQVNTRNVFLVLAAVVSWAVLAGLVVGRRVRGRR
ncbi:MAG TPA: hypothetical protein VFV35_05545 [Acidimicrobiales bacterium]|nr:hypothetical protein [Acidimicrobiales bacterium]